jgi:23S rRNA (cytosine1962-C5)-methyltransferase
MHKDSSSYDLLDSGQGRKLERFGKYILSRPCGQAVWNTLLEKAEWDKADATFSRDDRWLYRSTIDETWPIQIDDLSFNLHLTDFGHLGIFAEQIPLWRKITQLCKGKTLRVLNLFAYSGGSTIAAAQEGAAVCHLDASKGMVEWARKNAALNNLTQAPIRWIVEDAGKFLTKEIRRGSTYDGIILDPPSFGRGSKGEVFKIEEEIIPLLDKCRECLTDHPSFLLLSSHSQGFTPTTLRNLLKQTMQGLTGSIEEGEMTLLSSKNEVVPIPSGAFAIWTAQK